MAAVLVLIGVILFVLEAFAVKIGTVQLGWLGLAFFAASFLVAQLPGLRSA
jgi:membrane-bound ClpP family serine protease